jgi:Do/DeqQ family serine protease
MYVLQQNFKKMKNFKKILVSVAIATISAFIAIAIFSLIYKNNEKIVIKEDPKIKYAQLDMPQNQQFVDFTYAAEQSIHTVVHVKTKSAASSYTGNPLYDWFFGYNENKEPEPVVGIGSGVIISSDGYIVTNYHVIEKSDEIEVTLNDKRTFKAEIIGTDPSTDLAVLKINAKELPFIKYGNSDDLKIGEWVLAVGNPYNLTSTVTAGIVSAKARNINIMQNRDFAIEAFIQTDAAVNPGNSGGALVNTKGELVGINTAIASQTGAYSGYSFAIPVSIVKKIVTDIIEFGEVQRAILGVSIQDVTDELVKKEKLDTIEGVFVNDVKSGSAAEAAGIKKGDIIISINDVVVNNTSELQEQVSRYRPNDVVNIIIKRDNKKKQIKATLRNMQGNTEVVKKGDLDIILGAKFREITENEKKDLNINNGLKVIELNDGKFKRAGIEKNFIIIKINNKYVYTVDDLKRIINSTRGGVYIEGIYPSGTIAYYAFGL